MLKKILALDYELELLSGMHIGGSTDTFDIGGPDSTVIKNPINGQPYIPGSSVKGKVRYLLTLTDYIIEGYGDNQTLEIKNNDIKALFTPIELDDNSSNKDYIPVSRAIFSDAILTDDSARQLQEYLGFNTFTEIKAENKINPLKGKAENPRFIERVPAGSIFSGRVILQIFTGDPEEKMKNALLQGFKMLENNFIGGSGSRGYGRISFTKPLEFKTLEYYENI